MELYSLSADVPIRINSLLHHFRDIGHRIWKVSSSWNNLSRLLKATKWFDRKHTSSS